MASTRLHHPQNASLNRKNKAAVNLKTVLTVLRFTAALFFLLKLFSSHIYCILKSFCTYFKLEKTLSTETCVTGNCSAIRAILARFSSVPANTNLFHKSCQELYLPRIRPQYPRRIANLPTNLSSCVQIVHRKLTDVGKCFLILTDRLAEPRLFLSTTVCLPN